ncbi:ATP-binding protein [Sporomusa malonica]|uniref:histidine kinase n=1 Tax=Sporomusa malonica TaxID=112901 RepID=A0A1W2DTN3_9FIRM|nr:ATP-binding protein [Sporomusa malonica]SMD00803.1 two-component system, chemotaxis family, sensor kinase CheA [Sporomusa malonica]
MTLKTRLLVISLLFGMLPIFVMVTAGNQTGLGINREFHSTMAIAVMITVLVALISPGLIRHWFFSNQVKKIKEFCEHVKNGRYDVLLTVPNERSSEGNENELVDLMRDMNWMVHRIKVNESELKQAVAALEQSKSEIQSQKKALEEVNAEQLVVQHQLQGRTRELKEAADKVRNLLDNAGQGFLSFGEDLKVTGEYSAECIMIFNQEIGAAAVPELLYPEDNGQQVFLTALFKKIFQEEDELLKENYFSLLPEELQLDGSYIQITYKLINHPVDPERKEILLILTDITQQRDMEKKIQEEKNVLSMVVRAVTHYREFSKAMTEYQLFCQEELPDILFSQESPVQKLSIIFRAVHTWKGTFGQLGIHRVAAGLHELESVLAKLRDEKQGNIEQNELVACFARYQPETLYNWLEQELEQLKKILGDQFFLQDETIVVENCKLHQLEEKVQRLLAPCQAKIFIGELRRLRYKPFSDLLNMFPEYIANLALNQGKEINFSLTPGAKILVDPIKYHDFAKSLVHVFRNAVAHGLETPDERLAAGKDVLGELVCNIANDETNLIVRIADDGRGIDSALIRRLAVAKGLCDEVAAGDLSNEEAVQLIFADGFSSAGAADQLSGRGVGLSAVKQEVEKLGGHIEVDTEVGRGTQFTFELPLTFSGDQEFDVCRLGEQVLIQAKTFLKEEFGVLSQEISKMEASSGVVNMRNISTFIDIKGTFAGRLMISADEALVKRLAECYLHEAAIEVTEEKIWLESAFSEFFNTTVGNSLQQLPDWQEVIDIGTPVTIWAEGASARYAKADIYSWVVTTDLGKVYLSLISFMRKDGDEDGTCISC